MEDAVDARSNARYIFRDDVIDNSDIAILDEQTSSSAEPVLIVIALENIGGHA